MNTICTCSCHVIGAIQFDFAPCCEHCYMQFAKINAEDFIKGYCERSGMSRAAYDQHYVCMPCCCDEPECVGWATIDNDPASIAHQAEFYGPPKEPKP